MSNKILQNLGLTSALVRKLAQKSMAARVAADELPDEEDDHDAIFDGRNCSRSGIRSAESVDIQYKGAGMKWN